METLMTRPTIRLLVFVIVLAIGTVVSGSSTFSKWIRTDAHASESGSRDNAGSRGSKTFAANAPADDSRVLSIGAMGTSAGWLLTEERLLWSDNDGATWRDGYTAPQGAILRGAYFLDQANG